MVQMTLAQNFSIKQAAESRVRTRRVPKLKTLFCRDLLQRNRNPTSQRNGEPCPQKCMKNNRACSLPYPTGHYFQRAPAARR